jgi:hypothetical protein
MARAIVSNLPISELETARPVYAVLAKLQSRRMRIRYRGPRSGADRSYCLKSNARAFSIYFD